MTMRSKDKLDAAAKAVDEWLDSLDVDALASGNDEHADLMRKIGDANKELTDAVAEKSQRLVSAIRSGKQGGLTQSQIAVMLGVSRQAVQQRFGDALADA
ncbi:MAG: hypothetical protein M3N21_06835 [Actinomycetota bacterium]|nr:hypothetical protein [Actinomycetota bacterium]